MKQHFYLLLRSITFIATILFTTGFSFAHDFEVGGIYYNITNSNTKTVEVTYFGEYRYNNPNQYIGEEYNIPSSIMFNEIEYNVNAIGNYAFQNCTNLTTITLPNSIKEIGIQAFSGCSGLSSINIPDSINVINNFAFDNCSNLTAITLPNSIKEIGIGGFQGCSVLSSINIPDSVKRIADKTFLGCTNLTNITMGDSITHFGSYVFSECTNLNNISIPKSLKIIGNGAFSECHSLSNIYIPESVSNIYDEAFMNCHSLTTINLPNNLDAINNRTFMGCNKLTSITIPNSVTTISYYAFQDCSSLVSITIPNSLERICSYAFKNCSSLSTPIVLPNSTIWIEDCVFENCTKIDSVSIPTSVFLLGKNILLNTAWYNRQPDGVLYLDKCCLGYKGTLTGDIKIDEPALIICDEAFYGCNEITSLTMSNSVKIICEQSFAKCTGLSSITIPESVQTIRDGAFYGCTNVKSIYFLAKNCATMGTGSNVVPATFQDCPFKAFIIGDGVTRVPEYTFPSHNIAELRIPKSVTYFNGGNLTVKTCLCYNPTPPSGIGCSVNQLFVPKGSLTAYASADGWKNANHITEFDAGSETKHTFTIAYPEGGVINQKVTDGECLELQIVPTSGWEYNTITFNDVDITNQLDTNGNYLTLPITSDCRLSVVFVKNDGGIANALISNDIKIYTQGKTVTISGASESSIVEIYDTSGVKIYSGFEKAITLDNNGIYILSTEGHIFKFAL